MFGERVQGDRLEYYLNRQRDVIDMISLQVGISYPMQRACDEASLKAAEWAPHNSQVGVDLGNAGIRGSVYNHAMTPNSATPDCADENAGAVSARSFHGSGVHVGLCDGSVAFYSNQVDLQVWQTLSRISD